MTPCRVAVVGAGPAGLAAAVTAAEAGLHPTLLDDNPLPGGQIYRRAPAPLGDAGPPGPGLPPRGAELLQRFQRLQDRISYRAGRAVWGFFPPRRLSLRGPGGVDFLDA